MLIIRREQLEGLGTAQWRSFNARLAVHLRDVVPAQAAALGEGLEPAIEHHLAAARESGFTTERDLARYVDLVVALGPGFGDLRASWIGRIVADPGLDQRDRISVVYLLLPQKAPECADLAAWWAA